MNEAIIRTYTGKMVNIFDIKPCDIDIMDIAHSLSLQCRYNGHINKFRSVAEHSIEVAELLGNYGKNIQLAGLLHDATEAYIGDIPSPIKKYFYINGESIADFENSILNMIYDKYGVVRTSTMRMAVHQADVASLEKERANKEYWNAGSSDSYINNPFVTVAKFIGRVIEYGL